MNYPQTSFVHTTFSDSSLLGRTRSVAWTNTIPLQLDILKSTGRYDAFKLEHKTCYDDAPNHWPVPNHLFWDSDVGKWIEGACYFLAGHKNEKVLHAVEELVEMIRGAQQPDGYLNIHFTVVAPDQKWTNLRDLHELYNAGHLIETALAHENLFRNGRLLEPILKYVDLMCKILGRGPDQIHGYPGHPEIELALLRLYAHTKDSKHLALAEYFITERGNPQGCQGRHFYAVEAENRGERPYERPNYYPERQSYWYQQAHKPVVEQREIMGHSVRAMYLLTAVADLVSIPKALEQDNARYREALDALWKNMVQHKMSVTGGIGAMKQWEGFGINDFLPQSTDEGGCYNETCASIGIMLLANRMLQLELDHKYADVLELALYNTVMTGMSRDGKRFTYVNQLGSSDQDLSQREEWFTCACCPPNVSRLLGSLGGYVWDAQVDAADSRELVAFNVHLYTSASTYVDTKQGQVKFSQTTDYPSSGEIGFKLEAPQHAAVIVRLRIPSWALDWKISPPINNNKTKRGYLELDNAYMQANPEFTLELPLEVRTVSQPRAHPNVFSLARGPLVYCVEDIDNQWVKDHFRSIYVDLKATKLMIEPCDDHQLGEHYVAIKAKEGIYIEKIGEDSMPWSQEVTYQPLEASDEKIGVNELRFVPYFMRANRGGRGQMRVGLKKL